VIRYIVPLSTALAAVLLFINAAGAAATGGGPSGERPPEAPAQAHVDPVSCPICALAKRLELRLMPLVRVPRHRCTHVFPAFVAAEPRGRVRADALTHIRVALHWTYMDRLDDGETVEIEFRVGERVIGRHAFAAVETNTQVELSEMLRLQLQATREAISWGSTVGPDAYDAPAFEVDDPTWQEARRLRTLDERLRLQPDWIGSILRAQVLLDLAFFQDARDEAQAALTVNPREPHAAAILHQANVALGLAMDEQQAHRHALDVVGELWLQRRSLGAGERCMLDEPLQPDERPRRVRTARRPRGGC
jgi:hypothetical protein